MKRKYESKYLKLFRQHQQGLLTVTEFENACKELHYTDKKNQLHRIGSLGIWYKYNGENWEFESWLTGRNRGKLNVIVGHRKRRYLEGIIAIVMIFVLLVVFVFPASLSDMQGEFGKLYDWVTMYRSPKIEENLLDNVSINAPKGALYEGQSLDGYEVDLDTTFEKMIECDIYGVPLYAFEFDAGMAPDESFNKPVELKVKLESLDADEEDYSMLSVYRFSEDGSAERLESVIEGDELVIYTTKNSVLAIIYSITEITAALVVLGTPVLGSIYYKFRFDGQPEEYYGFRAPDTELVRYMFYIPKNMLGDLEPTLKKAKEDGERLMAKYGLKWSEFFAAPCIPEIADRQVGNSRSAMAQAYDKQREAVKLLMADPEYKNLIETYSWNKLPQAVQVVAAGIKPVHTYFFKKKNLREFSDIVDVIVMKDWIGKSGYGYEGKDYLNRPYIQLDPNTIKSIMAGGAKGVYNNDSLISTLAHEMTHALQHEYYDNYNFSSDIKYCEATAVLMESEASKYLLDKSQSVIFSYEPTSFAYSWLMSPWNTDLTDKEDEQERGYAFSIVLRYKQEEWKKSKVNKDLLETLLISRENHGWLGSSLSGVDASIASIYDVLGSEEQDLMYDFMTSVYGTKAANFLMDTKKLIQVKTSESDLVLELKDQPCTITPYTWQLGSGMAGISDPNAVLLYYMDEESRRQQMYHGIHMLYSIKHPATVSETKKMDWLEINSDPGIRVIPVNQILQKDGSLESTIFVTDDKQSTTWSDAGNVQLKMRAAVPPEKALDIKYDEDSMSFVIKLEPDQLTGTELMKGRVVELSVPGTSINDFQKYVEPGVDEVRVHIVDLLLNEGEADSPFNTVAGKMVEGIMTTNMRASVGLLAASSQGMLESKWNGEAMYLGIKESFTITNSDGEVISPAKQLTDKDIPYGLNMSVSVDSEVTSLITINNGAYISLKSSLDDTFRYMRYTVLPSGTGANMEKAQKRLKELDESNKVICTIRNVYSEEAITSLYEAVKSEKSYNKTVGILLGPKSPEIDMQSPRIDSLPIGLQDGIYQGKNLFRMATNLNQVIRKQRDQTRDQRIDDAIEEKMNDYIESNKERHKAMNESKGSAAVYNDIEVKRAEIKADVIEKDMKFDSDFYVDLDKAIKEFNTLTYSLQINGSKAILNVGGVSLEGSIVAGTKQGEYQLSAKMPDKTTQIFQIIMLPNGNLIIKGEPVILKRY